jgi:hypothetical protein
MEGLRDLTNTVGVNPKAIVYYLTHHTDLSRQINYHRNHMLTWANQDQRRLRELGILLRNMAWPDHDRIDDQTPLNRGLRV